MRRAELNVFNFNLNDGVHCEVVLPPQLTCAGDAVWGKATMGSGASVVMAYGAKKTPVRNYEYGYSADIGAAYSFQSPECGVVHGVTIFDGLTPGNGLQELWRGHNLPGASDTMFAFIVKQALSNPEFWNRCINPVGYNTLGWLDRFQLELAKLLNESVAQLPSPVRINHLETCNAIFAHACLQRKPKDVATAAGLQRSEADAHVFVFSQTYDQPTISPRHTWHDVNAAYEERWSASAEDPYVKLNRIGPLYATAREPQDGGKATWEAFYSDTPPGACAIFGLTDGPTMPRRGKVPHPFDTREFWMFWHAMRVATHDRFVNHAAMLRKPSGGFSDDILGVSVDNI